jgi:WD40 repeat protein
MSGKQLVEFKNSDENIQHIEFSPDGKFIFTRNSRGISFWDISGKRLLHLNNFKNNLRGVTYSPDGKHFAINEQGGMIKIFNIQGEQITQFDGNLSEKDFSEGNKNFTYSPDGENIAFNTGRKIKIWDLLGSKITEFISEKSEIKDIQYSPNSKMILVHETYSRFANHMGGPGGSNNISSRIRLLSRSGHELFQFRDLQQNVHGFSFSADSQAIAILSGDGVVQIFDVLGREIQKFRSSLIRAGQLKFSPDGKKITLSSLHQDYADESYDNKILKPVVDIWDLSGSRFTRLVGHQGRISDVRFSPHNKTILTRGNERTARVWDFQGKQLLKLDIAFWDLGVFIQTPNGKRLEEDNEYEKILRSMDWSSETFLHGIGSMDRSPSDNLYAKDSFGLRYLLVQGG